MSAWTTYNTTVTFIVGETEYEIPIDNLNVSAGPYSRVAGDSVLIKAFDGRYYSRHQGWRVRATLSWGYFTSDGLEILREFLVDLLATGSCTAVFQPEYGTQRVVMVAEDLNEALVAVFDGNNRFRPCSVSLISQNISDVAPDWISGEDPGNFATMYVAGNDLVSGNTKVYIAKCARDESNLGAWPYTYLEFTKSVYGSFNKGGFHVDETQGIIFAYMTVGSPFTTGHAIRKFDLSGNYLGDVYETGESVGIDSVAINKIQKEIYISLTGPGTSRILAYDYEGNLIRIVIAQVDAGSGKWMRYIAYDDGWIYYLRKGDSAFDNRKLRRVDRLGVVGEQLLGAEHATADTGTGPARANIINGYYFHDNNADGLRSIPIPGAGSISTVDSDAHNNALDVDWIAERAYIPGASRIVRRMDFLGANEETIVTFPSGVNNLNSIQGIALGL